jgi:O-antigen/teichoic acid export membrane protein
MRSNPGSLSRVVVGGSAWASVQMVLSKGVTLAATVVFARLLTSYDYAAFSLALTIAGAAALLAPSAMSDLIVAEAGTRNTPITRFWPTAIASGVVMAMLVAVLVPVATLVYGRDSGLSMPLLLLAMKCIIESIGIVPFSSLRARMRFRDVAIVEAISIVLGVIAGLGSAVAGLGASSLVMSLLAGAAVRTLLLLRCTNGLEPQSDPAIEAPAVSRWIIAGAGQYVHAFLSRLDVLFIGYVCTQEALGFYAWAVTLAFQTQAILISQLGAILQPVLAVMANDEDRQLAAHRRVCRLISCLGIPAACIQAAVAAPLIGVVFSDRWMPAVPAFSVLSIHMAMGINTAAIMALMKARGQFSALLWWQLAQTLVSAVVFLAVVAFQPALLEEIAIRTFGPAVGGQVIPLAIAASNAVLWGASTRLARIWILGEVFRRSDIAHGAAVWTLSAAACTVVVLSRSALITVSGPLVGDIVTLAVIAPVAYVACVLAVAMTDGVLLQDVRAIRLAVVSKLGVGCPRAVDAS